MRYLSLGTICLLSALLAACASSKQHSDSPKSTFKTERTATNFGVSSGGLAMPSTIIYQMRAQCEGQNCIPKEADLSFHLESGSKTVYLKSRHLSITAGEERYEWRGQEWTNIHDSPPVVGLIKKVSLEWDELVQIAQAKEITGNLGGQNFEWTYQNRGPLRKLVSKINPDSTE